MSEGLANMLLPDKAELAKILGSSDWALRRSAKPGLIPMVRLGILTLVRLDHYRDICPWFGSAQRPTRSVA
jgi:hypothetical protein